ncbi:LLM class F420-dependent oxidoreductase [Gordonia aichiensis]|uniref:Putative oxidoreductase n=1 Tax=Gordonia aichiensis NBRC 108223 TaxID=1220583 RepID=L7KL69_9ACTN|nr:LLM class F420-dependent oxidoreductase [Gordonia aichiensis]GAC49364.1 putative oxidoreductase [Gordonia aichiensis NBRC 108223]
MELRIFTEPQQGATYATLLRIARASEDLGYDAFFRSDHYLAMNAEGLPGPTDAWLTLAALGRETSTIKLGTLVTSATFRHPGQLAIQVAQADEMSGGRIEFGLGAGWFAEEHEAYAIPFPALGERFERLTENLEIITGLWSTPVGDLFDYSGKHFEVKSSPALPKPVQSPRPPIIIGGMGRKRTPALAARFADEFNVPFAQVDVVSGQFDVVRDACRAAGRGPDELTYSAALTVCVGRNDAEVAKRADAIGRSVDELRENGLAGTPSEVVEKMETYRAVGVSRLYLQVLDLDDVEHIEFIANEVAPQL